MTYPEMLLRMVEDRVDRILNERLRTDPGSSMGTVVTREPGTNRATVVTDDSSLAVPVKVFGHVSAQPGDRVGLRRFGSDWVIVGSFGTAWQPYDVALSAGGTPLTIGNGSYSGRYFQAGETVFVRASITFGSTTTLGSGNYAFRLPVGGQPRSLLSAFALDASTVIRSSGVADFLNGNASGDNMRIVLGASTATNGGPIAWAAGDILSISGTYEAV